MYEELSKTPITNHQISIILYIFATLMAGQKTDRIESLFDSISKDYDKLNHLLSLGTDRSWRRRALKWIVDPERPLDIIDIACGTGDFAIAEARKTCPGSRITGLDLSEGMLEIMRRKVAREGLDSIVEIRKGDSEKMDYEDCSFDRATIAFGIRNFENREVALKEILRILKPQGRLVILELSVPSNKLLRWGYNIYFTKILPIIGAVISGDKEAYSYLPASVLAFPVKEEWMKTMSDCGYRNVSHKAFTFGICRMYIGEK